MPADRSNPPTLSQRELLGVLDSDPERAKQKYAELFQKLTRYFEWNRQSDTEDLAQEVLRRGFARLQAGQKITAIDPAGYFFGIARNLLREGYRVRKFEELPEQFPAPNRPLFRGMNANEQSVLLKQCMQKLSRADLELLVAYVDGEGDTWAEKTGISGVTVRMRVHRIRKRLEVWLNSPQNKAE